MGMLFLAVMPLLRRSLLLLDLGPQAVRFAVIDLVVFSGFPFRKRLTAGRQKMRARLNSGLRRAGQRGQAPKPLPIVPPRPGDHCGQRGSGGNGPRKHKTPGHGCA
ncbi:hypothetical protein [Amycolatopsis sp. YIM 10]|uniref:hypothetical protein n=1 Tax=Amycolatopsis sp. YIM 10 TaxID=2653857 RepID=UPI0012903005|nr:hypothetical protein [Amycolatopsis sp. YIM 10]QFU92580.1 hypothetical protein YIM_37110 [Amycolatopsis sp. YIM 10]